MLCKSVRIMGLLLFCGAMLAQTGCACGTAMGSCATAKAPRAMCDRPAGEVSAELPPNAKAGECYAKVFVPPTYRTVTEQVLIRDAYEKLEIIPAQYEWVEDRILVKDASKKLATVPAEFAAREDTIQTSAGYTGWEINKNVPCENPKEQPARDVFCLVDHPPVQTTVKSQRQVKAASVQEETIPAEYQTIRRQKLVSAATTRKVSVPAEYDTIEKTVKVCDGRMAWQRVNCEKTKTSEISLNR